MNIKQKPDFETIGIKADDLKFHFKIIEAEKLKAIVAIDFGDFKIKGFRIYLSKYENTFWVTPPCYKDHGGRYHPIFFLPNKELWEKVKFRLLDEFHKASEEYYKKRFDLNDDGEKIDVFT